MSEILDRSQETDIAVTMVAALEDAGYTPEECIPGLTLSIREFANKTENPPQALDEAVRLLDEEGEE